MYQKITVRKGSTFRRNAKVRKPGANPRDKPKPVDITGWGITAVVKRDARLIANVAVKITDAASGEYVLRVPDTSGWPVGDLLMDICYQMPPDEDGEVGDVFYTPSVTIACISTETPRPMP